MQSGIHHQLLDKVRSYKVPDRAVELLNRYPPTILAGATASGKTAIAQYLQDHSNYRRIITHTTRQPRHDEQHESDYWFVNEAEMLKLLESEAMIEVKAIHGDTVYGISIAAYEVTAAAGDKPLLAIDIQGIDEISKKVQKVRPVFILPPSFEVWMERLDKRGAMSHVERQRRLQSAQSELSIALKNERFILVINHEIPSTAKEIMEGVTDQLSQRRNRELAQMLIDHISAY